MYGVGAPDGAFMNTRLLFGLGAPLAGLLIWNTASLPGLESRLAALEAGHAATRDDPTAASTSRTASSTQGARRPAARRSSAGAATSPRRANGRAVVGPGRQLGHAKAARIRTGRQS